MGSRIAFTLILLVVAAAISPAQSRTDRERARTQNKLGWDDMRSEAWERAARSFQNAIDIDPQFEIPYYGLGRANMALKKFTAAIDAYERCRSLYQAQAGRADTVRQLQNQRRDIQESIQRGDDMTIESTVPAWVSLALGSAYFRSGRLSDAEREYKATIASDNRAGEAHSNLAVVYFETGRYTEAATSLQSAKKAGFKVNPELERAIRDKSK